MLPYSSYDDEELIRLTKNSDEAAFTQLYDRYHQKVYGYIFSLVKVPHLTEDLVHEVFIKVWERREKTELRICFSAYLFRICHNKAVDATKKIASERKRLCELLSQYTPAISGERPIEEQQRIDNLVEEALGTLTRQRRKVYDLCKLEGKSYKEAAVELGISPHTVKEHMVNALATLRSFLHDKTELTLFIFMLEQFI